MSSGTRSFAYDGRDVFLTYPQCGELSRERVRDFLTVELGVRRFLVARELHDDGNPHIHAYASWDTRRRFADARVFDVDGHHPNIQKPRSAKAVGEYCSKYDVEALRNFELTELESGRGGGGWRDLLRDCPDASTFWHELKNTIHAICVYLWEDFLSFASGGSGVTDPSILDEVAESFWSQMNCENGRGYP